MPRFRSKIRPELVRGAFCNTFGGGVPEVAAREVFRPPVGGSKKFACASRSSAPSTLLQSACAIGRRALAAILAAGLAVWRITLRGFLAAVRLNFSCDDHCSRKTDRPRRRRRQRKTHANRAAGQRAFAARAQRVSHGLPKL